MTIDLIFYICTNEELKEILKAGKVTGSITCCTAKSVESYANIYYKNLDTIVVLVIDPMRVLASQKVKGENLEIMGEIPMDAVIDKISVAKMPGEKFHITVKNFD